MKRLPVLEYITVLLYLRLCYFNYVINEHEIEFSELLWSNNIIPV